MAATQAVVLMPSRLLCPPQSPYRQAAEAALREGGGDGSDDQRSGMSWHWRWEEPVAGSGEVQAQAQAILREQKDVGLVLVPGLDPPYQAHYFTRVIRHGDGRVSNSNGGGGGEPIIHMTTLRLAPYERAYLTAVALCRHFGWEHVALLSSDDHHMHSAQGLRQQLTGAGIHIRRHQIFSPSTSSNGGGGGGGKATALSSSGRAAAPTSGVSHDLDAIRTSGARVVFLLSSCGATHEVLSTARRKGMLRDYAWIVLHPTASCSLGVADAGDGAGAQQLEPLGGGDDLDILETYQGVLGLAWSAPTAAAASTDGDEPAGSGGHIHGTPFSTGGNATALPPLPEAAAEALAAFCGTTGAGGVAAAGSDADDGGGDDGALVAAAEDPLDLSPRFLYEALRHVATSTGKGARTRPEKIKPGGVAGGSGSSSSSGSSESVLEGDGLDLAHDVGVSILSFSGARRVPPPFRQEQQRQQRRQQQRNQTAVSSLAAAAAAGAGGGSGGRAATHIELVYHPIARLGGQQGGSDGAGRAVGLELLSSRPIRWPGDVRTQPRDLVEVAAWDSGGGRHGRHGLLSDLGGGGDGGGGGGPPVDMGPLVFLVAAVCIALTPLWNWCFKKLRRPPQPPCIDGACATLPPLSDMIRPDREGVEEAKAFIQARMAELTEKQAELMRSVEVDMGEVVIKTGIGQGSFSVVYKGYFQNSHVAIKVLRKVDERNFRRFLEEILLHKDLRHPNIVMFRGASWADGRLLMLVDYAGRGTLADVLRRSQGTLKWKLVKLNMALGIAKGMAFLHQTRYYDMWTSSYQRCIVHRDLKPQNILVTDSYHVQITDFGEARTVDHENTMTQVGTQLYVAPEVVRGERYSEKCDVYSFAVVLLAMLEIRPDVLEVFAEALSEIEKTETGITEERLKEPQDVEVTDACKTCPLNKQYQPPPGQSMIQRHRAQAEQQCPLAKHKEFKGVVAHAVTRAVVYDDLRPPIRGCPYPSLKVLIEKCWNAEAGERPSFASIVDVLDTAVRQEVVSYAMPRAAGPGPVPPSAGPSASSSRHGNGLVVGSTGGGNGGVASSSSSSLSSSAAGTDLLMQHHRHQQQAAAAAIAKARAGVIPSSSSSSNPAAAAAAASSAATNMNGSAAAAGLRVPQGMAAGAAANGGNGNSVGTAAR